MVLEGSGRRQTAGADGAALAASAVAAGLAGSSTWARSWVVEHPSCLGDSTVRTARVHPHLVAVAAVDRRRELDHRAFGVTRGALDPERRPAGLGLEQLGL